MTTKTTGTCLCVSAGSLFVCKRLSLSSALFEKSLFFLFELCADCLNLAVVSEHYYLGSRKIAVVVAAKVFWVRQ